MPIDVYAIASLAVGVAGAVATVYAARLQVRYMEQRDRAVTMRATAAPFVREDVRSPNAQAKTPVPAVLGDGVVKVSMIFPGSTSFRDRDSGTRTVRFSNVEVTLDALRVGSGDAATGFNIGFDATVGLHEIVLMWESETDRFNRDNSHVSSRTSHGLSKFEIVFDRPGPCTVRLDGSASGFYVKRIDPPASGRVLEAPYNLFSIGLLLMAGAALVIWLRWS